jgi:hypothetical protein
LVEVLESWERAARQFSGWGQPKGQDSWGLSAGREVGSWRGGGDSLDGGGGVFGLEGGQLVIMNCLRVCWFPWDVGLTVLAELGLFVLVGGGVVFGGAAEEE